MKNVMSHAEMFQSEQQGQAKVWTVIPQKPVEMRPQ